VDVSQGNAKLFGRDGALQAVLGRKGEGPGEFESPRYLLEDEAGGSSSVTPAPRASRRSLWRYEMQRDPNSPRRSIADLEAWSGSFHTATRPLSGDGFLLLQFVKGVLNYGDPAIAVYRDRTGAWFGLDDAPPIVTSGGCEVLAIANPLEDPVQLAIYRARR
jgi:hypothetical protein